MCVCVCVCVCMCVCERERVLCEEPWEMKIFIWVKVLSGRRSEILCAFGSKLKNQLILLFSLFLLLFINFIVLFGTFLVLFMSLTVLFQLTFTFIYRTFNKKFSVSVK